MIEATGVLGVDVGWVNGNYQRILFHSVRTASADRVRRMAAPRRHLALVCFLHQAWRDTLDQAVDMYGKLLDRNRKRVDDRLDDMLKAQRHAVDRIVQRYRRLGAVLLDPGVGDDELRARLLSTVPEAQLHADQSDLANWTRGDRRARFEQTAERHAGLSQFAAPFLSRMKFVDEQGEGTSPTLSALRVYREHRAAGRRGVPPDAPLDFAPAALQPLIRRDGVTDRRRWESALFLQVRDEIRESKFHKSRLVPLSTDTAREIEHVIEIRQQRQLPAGAETPLLWHRRPPTGGYSGGSFGGAMRALFRRAGIRTATGQLPRTHDFRHAFAVNALLRWYRAELDVQAKLPFLAAYMGHVSIVSTAYYLQFVEPLAAVASARFADHCGDLITGPIAAGGAR